MDICKPKSIQVKSRGTGFYQFAGIFTEKITGSP